MAGRRVAVTGMGVISSCGTGLDAFWDGLNSAPPEGERRIRDFDVEALFDNPKEARRADRVTQLALGAAEQALAQAGEITGDPLRRGVLIATGIGGIGTLEEQITNYAEKGARRVSPFLIPMMMPNAPSATVSMRWGWQGPCQTVSTACAAGTHALVDAALWVASGRCDVVAAGGSEAAMTPVGLAGFTNMTAMSSRNVSEPFAATRDGFVIAEGAAVLILEAWEVAEARGATILAEILGGASTADAHHITAPAPGGRGALSCMEIALAASGIEASAIAQVNAHGTSTPLNDAAEAEAMVKLFGSPGPPVTSIKGVTGHSLGAAGSSPRPLSRRRSIRSSPPSIWCSARPGRGRRAPRSPTASDSAGTTARWCSHRPAERPAPARRVRCCPDRRMKGGELAEQTHTSAGDASNMTAGDRLARLQRALDAAVTPEDVYDVAVHLGAQLAGAVAASVALLDASAEWVELVAHEGPDVLPIDTDRRQPADAEAPMAESIRTERILVVDVSSGDAGPQSAVVLPMRVEAHVVGALGFAFAHHPDRHGDEVTFLEGVVDACGQAVDRTVAATPEGAGFRRMIEAARGRLAFLSAATRELGRSLDRDAVLETLTQLVVPRFADWASVLLPEGDELVAATLVHRNLPVEGLHERAGRFRSPITSTTPSAEVYRTGIPMVAQGVDDDLRARIAAYPELAEHLAETRDRLVVPITVPERILGVLTLGEAQRAPFTDDDMAVAIELASRAGTALDNAARFTAERDMAEVLQRAILPADLPVRDEIQLTARYVPATVSARVGGDWYDAFELRDKRIGLCVGDVVGHGVTSAACMGQLRNALRVYALDGDEPSHVVAGLNRFTIDTAVTNYTTLVYAVLEPNSGLLEWTSAGHPAMVWQRDGDVELLDARHGMPIGVMDREYQSSRTVLEPGDRVLIYTDGLIERRTESLDAGLQRLRDVLAGTSALTLEDAIDKVVDQMAPIERDDDVCVLAFERAPTD